MKRFSCTHLQKINPTVLLSIGVDQDTGASVVIKLAQPPASQEMEGILENEYNNYLLIGAEGNLNKNIKLMEYSEKLFYIFLKSDPAISKYGIPQIMYFGEHGGYAVLVMEMLGPTLNDLKEMIGKDKLFEKTIWKIAIQAVNIFFYSFLFVSSFKSILFYRLTHLCTFIQKIL